MMGTDWWEANKEKGADFAEISRRPREWVPASEDQVRDRVKEDWKDPIEKCRSRKNDD
jgi:hypothetical protein